MRASLGLRTFKFRPHCGEAGDVDKHFANYLLADHVNHGIVLKNNAVIHYLYYLSQVIINSSFYHNDIHNILLIRLVLQCLH